MNYNNLSSKINSTVMSEIQSATAKFNITTPLRLCHFLSQCSHESGNFVLVRENLNYSIKGLMTVFHKYFTTEAVAKLYERQPQKIGNRVYANRMGNGDEASGDGYNYRGRGYIQLTGKDNYKAFATFIGEDVVAQPDLVATKYPLTSAGFFFNKNKLWSICDKGETIEVITELTKRINGGTNGLDDRIAKFRLYKSLI